MFRFLVLFLLSLSLASCQSSKPAPAAQAETAGGESEAEGGPSAPSESAPIAKGDAFGTPIPPGDTNAEGLGVATFAGGCFWCMEPPFEKLEGVKAVVSGYTGGKEENPTYKQVASGRTGHTEAVLVTYDTSKVTYDQLLDAFWRAHDPTDKGGQFADRGSQYRPEIFYHSEEQKAAAEASKKKLAETGPFDEPIVVPITPAQTFWPAEEYHQDFYKTNPAHYKRYSKGSGRVGFLEKTWGS